MSKSRKEMKVTKTKDLEAVWKEFWKKTEQSETKLTKKVRKAFAGRSVEVKRILETWTKSL